MSRQFHRGNSSNESKALMSRVAGLNTDLKIVSDNYNAGRKISDGA